MAIDVDSIVRVNTAVTAAEVIDGEAVIINLGDGRYFTMADVGGEVWLLVERGCSLRAMARLLAARHGLDEPRVLAELGPVVDELLLAGVIVIDGVAGEHDGVEVDWGAPTSPYAPPELVSYSDMEDVLALDPPLPVLDPLPER